MTKHYCLDECQCGMNNNPLGCEDCEKKDQEIHQLRRQILRMMNMTEDDVKNSHVDSGLTIDNIFQKALKERKKFDEV